MIDPAKNELNHLVTYKDVLSARLLNICGNNPGNNSVVRAKLYKEIAKLERRIKKIHTMINDQQQNS